MASAAANAGDQLDATNLRDFIDSAGSLEDVVPEAAREDYETVFDPLRALDDEVLDDLETGEMSLDEFGHQVLDPLLDDQEWVAANTRYTQFAMDECDLDQHGNPLSE